MLTALLQPDTPSRQRGFRSREKAKSGAARHGEKATARSLGDVAAFGEIVVIATL